MSYPRLFVTREYYHRCGGREILYAKVEAEGDAGHTNVKVGGAEEPCFDWTHWGDYHYSDDGGDWEEVTGVVTEEELRSAIGRRRCGPCAGVGLYSRSGACKWCEGSGEHPFHGTTSACASMEEHQTRLFNMNTLDTGEDDG